VELRNFSNSKSGIGNNVQVRFLFWALDYQSVTKVCACEPFLIYQNLQTICKQDSYLLELRFSANDCRKV